MCRNLSKYAAGVMALALLSWTMAASAQLPIAPSSQFDITGVVQAATLKLPAPYIGGNAVASPFLGGTLTVNGQLVIVPANTVVQFPANNSTWAEMFLHAPAPYGLASGPKPLLADQSGMALSDIPRPKVTWEVNVVGNRVIDGLNDHYVAGLITFSQEGLNAGQGYINYIDYANGEMWVGGTMGIPGGPWIPGFGARIRINDPFSVYSNGKYVSPDPRFTVDTANPTIRSVTGYPMGLSSIDPSSNGGVGDPLRPEKNRPQTNTYVVPDSFAPDNMTVLPGNGASFTTNTYFMMPDPLYVPDQSLGLPANFTANCPDSRLQAPFEVGDFVDYMGTLVDDTGTLPLVATNVPTTYIAAHTVIDNCAIYTAAGTNPAYVGIDVSILGTGGLLVPGLVEAATRTRFEGFATDPSRIIYLFARDLNPNYNPSDSNSLASIDRDWGSIDCDQGPPTGVAMGRWRFRAPKVELAPAGTGVLTMPSSGTFGAPTREVRAVLASAYDVPSRTFLNPAWQFDTNPLSPTCGQPLTYCHGIIAGQYVSPIAEYLFPEQTPGASVPENNFEAFQWLVQGGQVANDNKSVMTSLYPWPGVALTPPPAPGPITVSAGFNQTVQQNASVTLNGYAYDITGNAYALAWTPVGTAPAVVSGTETLPGISSPANYLGATTTAPKTGAYQYRLDVLDNNAKILTNAAGQPYSAFVTINVVPVKSGVPGITKVAQKFIDRRLSITASDARVLDTFTAAQYAKLKPPVLLTATTSGSVDSNGFPTDVQVPLVFSPASTDPITKVVTPAGFLGDIVSNGMNATSITVTNDIGSTKLDRPAGIDIAAMLAANPQVLKLVVGVWTVILLP
jgi:hypothetical protein